MLLELQKSLLRPHPGQRSAAVGSRRTLWRSPRIGLHPGRQRLGRAGGRRHGEADDGTYYVQQLASRTASVAQSAEVLDGADGLHEQDVDVKAILSDPHLEGDPLQFLKVTEAYWTALKKSRDQPGRKGPTVISKRYRTIGRPEFDVCVAGGTLGIFIALALQLRGHAVCVVERRRVEGRTQEWNISRGELAALTRLGLLSEADLESTIVSEWNPARIGFNGVDDIWVDDVLNCGVDPRRLIGLLRDRFVAVGGVIYERTSFRSAEYAKDGISIRFARRLGGEGASTPVTLQDVNRANAVDSSDYAYSAPNNRAGTDDRQNGAHSGENGASANEAGPRRNEVTARLLVDCMGHYSPIVKQMRGGAKPQGMVLVVGTCADGVPAERNRTSDLLCTCTDASADLQPFWEAFPAANGGRTTYMFTYADADKRRPSFEELLRMYFSALPGYQGVPLSQLRFSRVLFGGFPSFAASPLKPAFDRVLQVGDASASQSPLSFGGFGGMIRHLPRLTRGVHEALTEDRLDVRSLRLLQPYQPSLSASWLFQRSMAYKPGQQRRTVKVGRREKTEGWLPSDHINRLMRCNFRVMKRLGDSVMRPFLQDTILWWPLAKTMFGMFTTDPIPVLRSMPQVGILCLLRWFGHFIALGVYTLLDVTVGRFAQRSKSFRLRRWADAWHWGSGRDHADHAAATAQAASSRPEYDWYTGSTGSRHRPNVTAEGAVPMPAAT